MSKRLGGRLRKLERDPAGGRVIHVFLDNACYYHHAKVEISINAVFGGFPKGV
ncbi:MAG: hypothetical protein OXF07_12615 [Rhodobacter sp.]|nr:hypothetical protein [Rhodobacter sp.]MCY4243620.1 hypothetical protein [Rhodobacter sp.]